MVKSHPNDSGHTHAIPTSATHMHKNLRCGIMAQKSSWPARSPLPSSRGSAGRGGAGFIRGGWPDGRGGQATKRRPARLAPMRCRRSGTMTPAGAGGRGACAGAPPRAAWGSQQGMPRQPLAALCRISAALLGLRDLSWLGVSCSGLPGLEPASSWGLWLLLLPLSAVLP